MQTFNIHHAKTNLSKLIQKAEDGEEICIARAGKPVVKLVPVNQQRPQRKAGLLKGKIRIADNFDEPLPDDVMKAFYGETE